MVGVTPTIADINAVTVCVILLFLALNVVNIVLATKLERHVDTHYPDRASFWRQLKGSNPFDAFRFLMYVCSAEETNDERVRGLKSRLRIVYLCMLGAFILIPVSLLAFQT